MHKYIYLITSLALLTNPLFAEVLHRAVVANATTYEWTVDSVDPFDELVVSWNGHRPDCGEFAIYICVKPLGVEPLDVKTFDQDDAQEWSEPLLYAIWGANEQRTFNSKSANLPVQTNQDTLEMIKGAKASGFKVKIEARNGATLDQIWAIHAHFCDTASFKQMIVKDVQWKAVRSVQIPVKGRSQVALSHPRNMHLCSPTSTSAVVSHLKKEPLLATDFAAKVWDAGFDIYGNWIFATAQSADYLGKSWQCYMARFASFEQIYANLEKGIPTVVSVRGELTGANLPYNEGHLIAVIGYDALNDSILCMDPAYVTDNETITAYDKQEFLKACNRRGYIGYFFDKSLVVAPI